MAWGSNAWGTLGDGLSGGSSDLPVTVSGPREAASVSVGGAHMLAFGELFPTVASFSPSLGPAAGGAAVTVTGAGFTGATAVRFGAAEATSVTVNSATSITSTAPAGTGTVDVVVTNTAGPSPISSKDRFKYTPVVESLTLASGSTAGGESITVAGVGFAPGTTATALKFGVVKAKSVSCAGPISCTVVVPPGAAGTVDVRATVNKAVSAVNAPGDQFSYH